MSKSGTADAPTGVPTIPGPEFQRLFASCLLTRNEFATMFMPHIAVDYFDAPAVRWLVDYGRQYWEQYQLLPDIEIIQSTLLDTIEATADEDKATAELLEEALNVYIQFDERKTAPVDLARLGYVRDHAAAWLRQKALVNAAQLTMRDVANGRIGVDYVGRFQDALSVGHFVEFDGRNRVLAEYANILQYLAEEQPEPTGTGLAEVDAIMGGGVRPGELGVIVGGTGKGKSQWLSFIARNAMLANHRVMYITLEMSKAAIARRVWAGLVDRNAQELLMHQEETAERLGQLQAELEGDVWVERWAPYALSVNALRGYLHQVHRFASYQPTLLVVDYADVLNIGLKGRDAEKATWEAQGIIYGQLRALAVEENLPIWTASQTNRGGQNAREVELTELGDSYAKARVADVILTISATKADADRSEQSLKAVKVRNDQSGGRVRVVMNGGKSLFSLARNRWNEVEIEEDNEEAE